MHGSDFGPFGERDERFGEDREMKLAVECPGGNLQTTAASKTGGVSAVALG